MSNQQMNAGHPNSWTIKQKWIAAGVVLALILIGNSSCGGEDANTYTKDGVHYKKGTMQAVEPSQNPKNTPAKEREDPNAQEVEGYKPADLSPTSRSARDTSTGRYDQAAPGFSSNPDGR